MCDLNKDLVNWIFETDAIKVAEPDKPFWYTSGTIGPYYVNTHYLYGGEEKAGKMLALIEGAKNEPLSCTGKVLENEIENYKNDTIYKGVIDRMISFAKEYIGSENFDFISGGERRDWFFSVIAAHLLRKPHITLFKFGGPVIMEDGRQLPAYDINGAKVLHIADIVTEASSFKRAWIPEISKIGSKITHSLVVADRMQGGAENLLTEGIVLHSLIRIESGLFENAEEKGLITAKQFEMISEYIHDPRESMRRFLIKNKSFLKESLKAGGKTSERANLCIENNIYNI